MATHEAAAARPMMKRPPWIARVIEGLTVAVLLAAGSFIWQTHAALVELRTELRLVAEQSRRTEDNLRGLELWLRDYTIEHQGDKQ